ncbi:hypothetical protein IIY24_01780 [Candidatus Saccharibacteria bacterium]|nr:hypothetical protein [Candidatus Saccharibacteria bacterium]
MRIWKKIFTVVAVLTLLFAAGFTPVLAEGGEASESLVFGPTSQRITLEPGETYRGSVYISNPAYSTEDAKYALSVVPYGVSNENYDPVFDQMTSYTQIVDWITLDETEGSVRPNEKKDIGFTVSVPEDAPAGGQYATIMAQDMTHLGEEINGEVLAISNITAIGSIVVADVSGETRDEGEILENTIPSFLFSNQLTTGARVKNEGNVHTNAKYILQVWPLFSDEEICTNEEEPDSEIILPETEKYHTQECNLPSIGIFRAKQTVDIFGEISIAEQTVFICPLWLLFVIILAIVLIIMWLVMKSRVRKKASGSEK